MANIQNKFSRRTIALFWLVAVGIIIGVLIRYEQISILYVLATLALVVLLLAVAFADLEEIGRDAAEGFALKKE
jgi:heme A synthase